MDELDSSHGCSSFIRGLNTLHPMLVSGASIVVERIAIATISTHIKVE